MISMYLISEISSKLFIAESFEAWMTKTPDGFKYCNACGYQSKHLPDVRRHIEAKHMKNEFTCKFCGKTSNSKHNLTRHIKNQHPEFQIVIE